MAGSEALAARAAAWEALAAVFGSERAETLWSKIRYDGSGPFPSYLSTSSISEGERIDVEDFWRRERDALSEERMGFFILEKGDRLFPSFPEGDGARYVYGAGDKGLLLRRKIVFLGSPSASLTARSDTAAALSKVIELGGVPLAAVDYGLGAYALAQAVENGGGAIGVLSGWLWRCPSPNLEPLMEKIYEKGLLLTRFSPLSKSEKWHAVPRNRMINALGDAFFMAEEKDGGPSWPVFEAAEKSEKPRMISLSVCENPNFSWCSRAKKNGSYAYRRASDVKRLFPSPPKSSPKVEKASSPATPDLFG